MDLDALREALEKIDAEWPVVDVSAMNVAFAAARAVLDSEEIWWCSKHRSAGGPVWCDINELMQDGCNACSVMVRVRLLAEEGT